MVTDRQAKRLWQALSSGKSLAQAADKADMDEKTARKYRRLGRLPSEVAPQRDVADTNRPVGRGVWPEVFEQLQAAPGWSQTLFAWLQTNHSGSSTTRSYAAFSVA